MEVLIWLRRNSVVTVCRNEVAVLKSLILGCAPLHVREVVDRGSKPAAACILHPVARKKKTSGTHGRQYTQA